MVNVLGSEGCTISITTIQLCPVGRKQPQMIWKQISVAVSIEFYSQKQALGWLDPKYDILWFILPVLGFSDTVCAINRLQLNPGSVSY